MNTKHTPAPWYVIPDPAWVGKHPLHDARFVATCDFSRIEYPLEEGENGARPWCFENQEDSIICTMPDSENQKANARLIAAAPELLEALQQAADLLVVAYQTAETGSDLWKRYPGVWNNALRAIENATGERQ